MSSKIVANASHSHADANQERAQTESVSYDERTPLLVDSHGSFWGTVVITVIGAIFIVGLICGIYLILREDGNLDPPLDALALHLVTRQTWGANETDFISNEKLVLPAYKIVLLQSNGPPCYDQWNCCKEMYELQLINSINRSEFTANFMVGGDGRTYEGCGWDCVPNQSADNRTLTIGLIGTFQRHPPTELQVIQSIALVDYAIAEKKLVECYSLTVEPDSGITFLKAVAEVLQKQALC